MVEASNTTLALEQPQCLEINSFAPGKFLEINNRFYTKDLIYMKGVIHENWRRGKGHLLSLTDLELVVRAKPDVLIIGTGMYEKMKVPAYVKEGLESEGIEVHICRSQEATMLYEELRRINKEADVVLAIHLSC